MSHARSLCFEALEARRLLSRGLSWLMPKLAVVVTPLVLNGTLTVNNKAASTTMNLDGGARPRRSRFRGSSVPSARYTGLERDVDQFGDT